jgi:hypothetical protein
MKKTKVIKINNIKNANKINNIIGNDEYMFNITKASTNYSKIINNNFQNFFSINTKSKNYNNELNQITTDIFKKKETSKKLLFYFNYNLN